MTPRGPSSHRVSHQLDVGGGIDDDCGHASPALHASASVSAVRAATNEYTGAEAIVTTDTDFGVLPAKRWRILTSRSLLQRVGTRDRAQVNRKPDLADTGS